MAESGEPKVICRLCRPPEAIDGDIFDHLRLLHPGWDEGGTPVTDVTASFESLVMREADLGPHGCRCMDCGHLFQVGDRYAERLTGFAGDTPVVEIICVPGSGSV